VKTATLREVAEHAGVHTSTASRALNPETRDGVNAATARRVLASARSLGYQPNPIARSLRTNRTYTIGMLIPDLMNPLFPPIVRGAEDVLSEFSYTLLLANTDNDPDRERLTFEALRSRQVDGFIIATAWRSHPLTSQAVEQGLSVVLINGLVDGLSVPAVVADYTIGIERAVSHLVELGHRQIAFVSGPVRMSPGITRLTAFKQTMQSHGLEPLESLITVCDAWSEREGARALRGFLGGGTDFTAVVASDDLLALGCYDVVSEQGLTCPGDLSIVGFHDMPFVDKLHPPLTTVRVPHYAMGAESARMLLELLGQRPVNVRVASLPIELVLRGSTAPPTLRPGPHGAEHSSSGGCHRSWR